MAINTIGNLKRRVVIVDQFGNPVTSFGGGVQYNDGDPKGAGTGTLAMGTDGLNNYDLNCNSDGTLNINVSNVDVLIAPPVSTNLGLVTRNIPSGTQVISGTVTANISNNPLNVSTVRNGVGNQSAVTVSTTAVQLAIVNSIRSGITIVNQGTGNLYIGVDNLVTTSGSHMGMLIMPNGSFDVSGDGCYGGAIWGIYSQTASTQNVTTFEYGEGA